MGLSEQVCVGALPTQPFLPRSSNLTHRILIPLLISYPSPTSPLAPMTRTPSFPMPSGDSRPLPHPTTSSLFTTPTFPFPKLTPTKLPWCSAMALPFCSPLGPNKFTLRMFASLTRSSACTPFPSNLPCSWTPVFPMLFSHASLPGLPFSTAHSFAQHILHSGISTGLPATAHAPLHCLSTNILPIPKPSDWTQAYRMQTQTPLAFLTSFPANPQPTWTAKITSHVHKAYLPYLEANAIGLQGHFIVIHQWLLSDHHSLSLIVVPKSLRSLIFSAYHASPTSAHLGHYKTLHCIRQ